MMSIEISNDASPLIRWIDRQSISRRGASPSAGLTPPDGVVQGCGTSSEAKRTPASREEATSAAGEPSNVSLWSQAYVMDRTAPPLMIAWTVPPLMIARLLLAQPMRCLYR